MGIQKRLLYRLRSMRHFFMGTIIAVTSNVEKAWSEDFQNVVYHFCIFKIDEEEDIAKFVRISIY